MGRRYCALKPGALLLLGLSLAGCGSVPRTSHYTVNFTPVPGNNSPALPNSRLGVALPRASHLLRQDRIVYFTSGSEMNFYQYHRWAEPPAFMVQSLLIRQLDVAGLFDSVEPYRAQRGLDYVLRGRLLAMEEVDKEPQITARFALELELTRQEDQHLVWTGRHACERPVSARTVPAVVEAVSGCVQETLDELTRSLRDAASRLERATATEGEATP